MAKLMKCKDCNGEISKKAKSCPKCGCPVKKKTSRVTWLFLIFVVLLVFGVTTSEKNITSTSVAKENTAVKQVNSMKASRDKIQSLFQGKKEPIAKDALWTSNDIFKIGVIDDGTKRNGYASYACEVLYEYGFKGKKIWIQIIDIAKLTLDNDWVKLGESHCL
jgi:hypothetical protein